MSSFNNPDNPRKRNATLDIAKQVSDMDKKSKQRQQQGQNPGSTGTLQQGDQPGFEPEPNKPIHPTGDMGGCAY